MTSKGFGSWISFPEFFHDEYTLTQQWGFITAGMQLELVSLHLMPNGIHLACMTSCRSNGSLKIRNGCQIVFWPLTMGCLFNMHVSSQTVFVLTRSTAEHVFQKI